MLRGILLLHNIEALRASLYSFFLTLFIHDPSIFIVITG
jgi:hypothetical protein